MMAMLVAVTACGDDDAHDRPDLAERIHDEADGALSEDEAGCVADALTGTGATARELDAPAVVEAMDECAVLGRYLASQVDE